MVPDIMGLLIQVIDGGQDAASEAWYALGLLANIVLPEGGFAPYFDTVHQRLLKGLAAQTDYLTCKACITVVSDVCRNLGPALPQPRLVEFMTALVAVLESQTANRDLKPAAIAAFADVGVAIEPFLARVLPTLSIAAAVPDPTGDDEDMEDYLRGLRHSCVTAWTGIFQAFAVNSDAPAPEVAAAQARARAVFSAA